MRLGVQLLSCARNAPIWALNSFNHTQFRFLSSTTPLSDTKKETEPQEDSTTSNPSNKQSPDSAPDSNSNNAQPQSARKSVAQADEELREKLEQMSGEGGASGIEYEDGRPNTMKRSVRNNMFRYI